MSIEQKKSLHLLSKKLIEHFVSPLVGLAHKIEVCCDDEVTLGFFVVGIVPAHQELFSEGVPMDFTGGVAVDQNQAIISLGFFGQSTLDKWKDYGDVSYWPFVNSNQFEEAKQAKGYLGANNT